MMRPLGSLVILAITGVAFGQDVMCEPEPKSQSDLVYIIERMCDLQPFPNLLYFARKDPFTVRAGLTARRKLTAGLTYRPGWKCPIAPYWGMVGFDLDLIDDRAAGLFVSTRIQHRESPYYHGVGLGLVRREGANRPGAKLIGGVFGRGAEFVEASLLVSPRLITPSLTIGLKL